MRRSMLRERTGVLARFCGRRVPRANRILRELVERRRPIGCGAVMARRPSVPARGITVIQL